jgi:hypothetical protein
MTAQERQRRERQSVWSAMLQAADQAVERALRAEQERTDASIDSAIAIHDGDESPDCNGVFELDASALAQVAGGYKPMDSKGTLGGS